MSLPFAALLLSADCPEPARIRAVSLNHGLEPQAIEPLSDNLVRLSFADAPSPSLLITLADALHGDLLPLDQPLPDLEQPGLLLMDMDSTAIQIECIDELAALVDLKPQVAAITERAMQGELDFKQSLRARVALLEGQPASIIRQVADNLPLTPGVDTLCAALKARGWKLAVASGGFVPMVEQLKQTLALDAGFANTLAQQGELLTGQVVGEIVDAERKAQILRELREHYQLPKRQVIAIGDGANDLKMLAEAGLGVAFEAKPKVRAAAQWSLAYNPLDSLLELLEAKGN